MTIPEDKCLFCAASLPAEYFKIYERQIKCDGTRRNDYPRVCPMCHDSLDVSAKLNNKCPYTSAFVTFKPIRKVNGNTIGILRKIGQLLVRVSHLEKRMDNLEAKKNG